MIQLNLMTINTHNFSLRPVNEKDSNSIAHYANNEKIFNNVRDIFPFPYTLKDAENFIKTVIENTSHPETHFAIDVKGEAVGMIGLHPKTDVYRKNIELGYWLGEPFWNKCILTEAVKLIVEYTFSNFDVNRIYGGVFESNPASKRVLEKSGFNLEAVLKKSIFKNNTVMDEYIYSLLKII